jgi:hypothetical protein
MATYQVRCTTTSGQSLGNESGHKYKGAAEREINELWARADARLVELIRWEEYQPKTIERRERNRSGL